MAESVNKRQSNAGKAPAVTPKSPPPGPGAAANNMVSVETALSAAVGVRVRLHTTLVMYPHLEGVILFIDPTLNALAFVTRPPKPTHHILALSSLKDFELLPNNAFPFPPLLPPGPPPLLDTQALMARANASLAKAKEKAAKKNPNVSKEAQDIFDALGRQLPTRWDGKDIIVMDQVVVRGPGYRPDDCKAGKGVAEGTLTRVKKVLENERRRLAQRDAGTGAKGPKPVIPAIPAIPAFSGGPRKGG
ncbi:hypothetical protein ACLMJK_008037 [Lecanora helva]